MSATNCLRASALLTTMAMATLVAASLVVVSPVHAVSTFTVDSTADTNTTACTAAAGNDCTLRGAINAANDTDNSAGSDLINFAIPGSFRAKTISPNSALPPITEALTIDGYSQNGASENTQRDSTLGTNAKLRIVLDGTNAGDVNGLTIEEDAENSVVRGLSIVNFEGDGIEVDGADNALIAGNHIGLRPDGSSEGNGGGVRVRFPSDNVSVGGKAAADHNVISANSGTGVVLTGTPTNDNRVLGNLIGLAPDGTSVRGNGVHGVLMNSGSSDNTIGGVTRGARNTIAFNDEDGVNVDNGTGNRILPNSIFSNGSRADELGIDLFPDGPNANDPGDADSGPNNLQNFPELSSAKTKEGKSTVKGRLNSASNKTFTLQFFSNSQGSFGPQGKDEGEEFIGEKSVTTNGSGNASFVFKPKGKLPNGVNITATATDDLTGDTSEFSAPKAVVAS